MAEWADQIERLRLVRTEGVGPVTYRCLLDRYHSPAAALDALPRLARAGGRSGTAPVVSVAEAERELERTSAAGGRMIFLGDPEYPPLLAMMMMRRRASFFAARPGWRKNDVSPRWAGATLRRTGSGWRRPWRPSWRRRS
jgi:hypothetical protein